MRFSERQSTQHFRSRLCLLKMNGPGFSENAIPYAPALKFTFGDNMYMTFSQVGVYEEPITFDGDNDSDFTIIEADSLNALDGEENCCRDAR